MQTGKYSVSTMLSEGMAHHEPHKKGTGILSRVSADFMQTLSTVSLFAASAAGVGLLIGTVPAAAAAIVPWVVGAAILTSVVALTTASVIRKNAEDTKTVEPQVAIIIKKSADLAPAIEHEHGVEPKHVERLQAQREEMVKNAILGASASV